jgi:hypothetical protein
MTTHTRRVGVPDERNCAIFPRHVVTVIIEDIITKSLRAYTFLWDRHSGFLWMEEQCHNLSCRRLSTTAWFREF